MVKITPELIAESPQYFNPIKDRELNLRNLKISVIENLASTYDQYDCLDLSSNDIRKLDGFPLLKRLKHLLLNHNHIYKISDSIPKTLPNLQSLIFSSNNISELSAIDILKDCKKLTTLSLLSNPIIKLVNYRLYVIYKVPQLKILDFQKIKLKEREEAARLFKNEKLESKIRTFIPGEKLPIKARKPVTNIKIIKEAIAKASSLEEIEKLQQLLNEGKI